jgi:hypothetical protein
MDPEDHSTTRSDWDRYDKKLRPSKRDRARMRGAGENPGEPDLPVVRMVRFVARAIGTILLVFLLAHALSGGSANPLKMRGIAIAAAIPLLAALAGSVIAWKREGLGGTLILGGSVLFILLNAIAKNPFNAIVGAFGTFAIVGFMYLFCWRQSARARSLTPY